LIDERYDQDGSSQDRASQNGDQFKENRKSIMTKLLSRASKKDSKIYEGGDSDSVFKTMKTGF